MNVLGYFYPERKEFVPLNKRLPVLNKYRYFVGACLLGKKWVAVYSQNGAFLLNIETNSLAPFPCAKEIEQNSSKYNCMVRDKKKRLWVGTQNGLYILMPTGRENDYVCERIAGLTNNCIRSLVVDAQDEVWAGTSCGICKIAEAAVPHHTFNVINFGAEDGFPTGGLMERAAILASDGRLVFVFRATAAVAFHPEQMVIETKPLDVVITAMNVAGKTLSLEALRHDLSLAYYHNNLTFQFSALNYASPSHTRYRYRLLGIEKDWQEGTDGSQGEVEYRALPPGQYTFEVQANIDGGKWGNTTTQTVTIRPPFWLTWWAKSIYCLLILMAITILINLYLSRKRKKMERENDQRVHRLFELREEARHQFAENTNIDPQKIGVNSEEETLAKRMLKAIEAHLSDTDYGVEQLAQDVGMSRSALYTKLRNMLGISPADFIRNVRLKRAAQLLSDTTLPISEIADRVGYNTHKAFVANFKKLFGMLPSEYREPKTS
jgi:AraC-like DNA-binding protein